MGILKDGRTQETPASAKRRSLQPDFSNLGPLKPGGTVGFLNFRDNAETATGRKNRKGSMADDMDSDDDEDESILGKADDEEAKEDDWHLSPDDLRRQGELAEGLRQIKVCSFFFFFFFFGQNSLRPVETPAFVRLLRRQQSQDRRSQPSSIRGSYPRDGIIDHDAAAARNGAPVGARGAQADGGRTGRGLCRQSAEETTGQCLPSRRERAAAADGRRNVATGQWDDPVDDGGTGRGADPGDASSSPRATFSSRAASHPRTRAGPVRRRRGRAMMFRLLMCL